MSLELNVETERRVEHHIGTGEYKSADEVVAAGLELLELRERIQAKARASFDAAIQEGLASLARGEGLDGETVFAELMADLDGEDA